VLARVFEAAGLVTVSLAMVREHVEKVKPPRALFVPYPFGYALGKPNDAELQHRVIAAALELVEKPQGPVLEEFPEDEIPDNLPQSSGVARSSAREMTDAADEIAGLRSFYERWVDEHDGRTAVGLSGVPQRRWRGLVRFLEGYTRGEDVDMKERPADVSLAQFIRYCVDDLKAFYYEARMAQKPSMREPGLHTWFWGETVIGQLIPAVGEHMQASDHPAAKAVAFGLAR
jgi:hypothetical protein